MLRWNLFMTSAPGCLLKTFAPELIRPIEVAFDVNGFCNEFESKKQ